MLEKLVINTMCIIWKERKLQAKDVFTHVNNNIKPRKKLLSIYHGYYMHIIWILKQFFNCEFHIK